MSNVNYETVILSVVTTVLAVLPAVTGAIILVIQHLAEIRSVWTTVNQTSAKVAEHDHALNGDLQKRIDASVQAALDAAKPAPLPAKPAEPA